MTSVFLVAGGTGAGKTTQAIRIAADAGALRFSIDEWMTGLFWMDSPQPIEFAWTMERIGRCEARIRSVAAQAIARGVPVVLDLGFTKAGHRQAFADWARSLGAEPRLVLIDLSPEVRWARVEARNQARGDTFSMPVDRTMFDFMEDEWEQPGAAERASLPVQVISE